MGFLDAFNPLHYIPSKMKFLIFLLILGILAPIVNGALLMGKGTIVCDSERTPYVITGESYSDLTTSNYYDTLFEDSPAWVNQKEKEKMVKAKIDRQRYLLATGASTIGVKLPLAYKKIGAVGNEDCVKCSLGNYTNCYDSITETWTNMEVRTVGEFPFFSRIAYYDSCKDGLHYADERMDITLSSDTEGDYWVGQIYNVNTDSLDIDDVIHSLGIKYSIKYKSEAGDLIPDIMPIACDRNYQPTVTLLGFPLFNPTAWILVVLIYLVIIWTTWARTQKSRKVG